MAEQADDERQADRRFGGCNGHDEERDDLPVNGPVRSGRTRQTSGSRAFSMISIDSRIVIRFLRRNTPAVPMAKQHRGDDQVVSERDHRLVSRAASTTAPTIATRIRIDVASNAKL